MRPGNVASVQAQVSSESRIFVRGGGSKSGLAPEGIHTSIIELGDLRGIQTYEPEEFTFSAYAGTPLVEIEAALSERNQFLPCEPPLGAAGATLGGSVAAGLSGPSSYLYGGIRDYILGIEMVAADGELIQAGGRVVKNAAGFDFSKLVVGSLGMYGVLTSLTFKVFPEPPERQVFRLDCPDLQTALQLMEALGASPLEINALELLPAAEQGYALEVMLSGRSTVLGVKSRRLLDLVQKYISGEERIDHPAEWTRNRRAFHWAPGGWALIKIPLTPRQVTGLEDILVAGGAARCYSVGANLAWVAWPGSMAGLDRALRDIPLSGLVVRGGGGPRIGELRGASFVRRVRQALDPTGKFVMGARYLGVQDAAPDSD